MAFISITAIKDSLIWDQLVKNNQINLVKLPHFMHLVNKELIIVIIFLYQTEMLTMARFWFLLACLWIKFCIR